MKKSTQLITSLFCFALGASSLYAATGTWIGGTGGGDWENVCAGGQSWTNDSCTIPNGVGEIANITANAAGGRSVTLNADRTVGVLVLAAGGATDPRDSHVFGSGTLTLDNGGSIPLITALSGNTGTNSVGVVIAGTSGLSAPNSGGRVVLAGANTYTGNTVVQRRYLNIRNVDAVPHGGRSGDVYLVRAGNPGDVATLHFQDLDAATINGLYSVITNELPFSQETPVIDAETAPSGTLTLSVGDNDSNGDYDGRINNGGSAVALTKIGNGTLTLGGINGGGDYSGGTAVDGGTLVMNGSYSGTGAINVNSGVLGGTGTIAGKVFVFAGGSIAPGASAGIMHLQGGLDLSAGGAYNWELVALTDNSTGTAGTDWDQIDYQWVSGDFDLTDSTLTVDLSAVNTADSFWNSDHTWTIINSFGQTGGSTPTSISVVGGAPPGDFTTSNNGTTVDLKFTYTGVVPFNPPPVKITSVVPTSPSSRTINYTNSVAGTNYVLQYRTDVASGAWTSVVTNPAAGTTSSSTDNTASGSPQRFYRVYGQF